VHDEDIFFIQGIVSGERFGDDERHNVLLLLRD
jgi:hypothetical protein